MKLETFVPPLIFREISYKVMCVLARNGYTNTERSSGQQYTYISVIKTNICNLYQFIKLILFHCIL